MFVEKAILPTVGGSCAEDLAIESWASACCEDRLRIQAIPNSMLNNAFRAFRPRRRMRVFILVLFQGTPDAVSYDERFRCGCVPVRISENVSASVTEKVVEDSI